MTSRKKRHFVDRNPDNERYVSLNDLLASDYSAVYDRLTPPRRKAFNDCRNRFFTYPFSVVYVREKNLDEVCEIFERLNQGGQRLNLFDLISASTWSPEFDLREAVEKENNKFQEKGFGKLDDEIYTQTLALVAKNSCIRTSQLQMRKEDITQYWEDTVKVIQLAVDHLRANLGVVNYRFIPYRGMISMVAYLFYKNKLKGFNSRQKKALDSWFWQVSFSERYGSSTLTLMTEDAKSFTKVAEGKEIKFHFPHNLTIESLMKVRMSRTSAIKNGFLCLLAKKEPRHFKNNSIVPLGEDYFSDFNNAEKHHIFPKGFVEKKFALTKVHSLPNFCFLPRELNREILDKKPSVYFKQYEVANPDFKKTLESHLVHYDQTIEKNDFHSFLGARANLILTEVDKLVGASGQVISDNADDELEKFEKQLRDFLDLKLLNKDAAYWPTLIPPAIIEQVERRLKGYLKKDTTKEKTDFTPRMKMDFCDFMDYPQIIFANWPVFYPHFRSKYEVERRFISLKEYRHAAAHYRELPSFLKKEGQAALEWFIPILKNAFSVKKKKDVAVGSLKRHRYRKKFWEQLLEESKKKTNLFANISSGIYNWISAGSGKSGLIYVYSIGLKLGQVELYIDKGKDKRAANKKIFDHFYSHRRKIEKVFGDKLEWERLDDKRACRIVKRYEDGGLYEEEKWPKLQQKMIKGMLSLEKALKSYIGEIK
ncbi:DUF4268 domain-containing protein [Patescibacteria group bacterium]